jgi:hypothetical protein
MKVRPTLVLLSLSAVALLLMPGCAPRTPMPPPSVPQPPPPSSSQPPEARPESGPGGFFHDQARGAMAQGDYDRAASILERALRVEPGNGRLWFSMAQAKFEQGNLEQSIQFARKAVSLAASDRDLERSSWRLMEQAYRGLGDLRQADAARARWQHP